MSELMANLGPMLLPLIPSFVVGWLIGRAARKALRTTLLFTGAAMAILLILAQFGIDITILERWVRAGSAWFGENLEGMQKYLAALMPSATAALAGGAIGFGRRGKRRGGLRSENRGPP